MSWQRTTQHGLPETSSMATQGYLQYWHTLNGPWQETEGPVSPAVADTLKALLPFIGLPTVPIGKALGLTGDDRILGSKSSPVTW